MPEQIRVTLPAETKALEDERALVVRITSPKPDRSGDVVVPKGGKLENFKKNPVVLFGHDYWSPPIAKATELSVDDNGIIAKVQFPTKGAYEFADTIYELCKQGIMNAWSIGFRALRDKIEFMEEGGRKFNEWELFEFSAVPVPAHPDALTLLRSAGFDDKFISKALDEEVLVADEGKNGLNPDGSVDHDDDEEDEGLAEIKDVAVTLSEDNAALDLTFSLNDTPHTITYPFTDDQKAALTGKAAQDELKTSLLGMRDALKAKDANLLTALETMKGLLEPATKGGE